MKSPSQVPWESKGPTGDTDPLTTRSDSPWKPGRTTSKPDRSTYQAGRWAELDRIRQLDVAYRQLLRASRGNSDDRSRQDTHDRKKGESERHLCRRVLVHAVEGYLLGCVEYPEFNGETALGRATSTGSLIDLLQAEETLMIRTFGPPWVEPPFILEEGSLSDSRLSEQGSGPVKAVESSSWPWR